MNTNKTDKPLCADCLYWRNYAQGIDRHPDYDGHCWLKGIMTLNVTECREHDSHLTVKDGRIEIEYENAG